MRRRLFTVEEQARTDERVHDIAQAFMWTQDKSVPARVRSALGAFAKYAAFAFLAVLAASAGIACLAEADAIFAAGISVLVGFIILSVAFIVYMTYRSERLDAAPPVFLFYSDKLFYIQADEDFNDSQIQKIADGEIKALRKESGPVLMSVTSAKIEAECYYIKSVKEHNIGNETEGLDITVIEDIVDVDVDEDDESMFIITYEDVYGDEVELRLSMDTWGELYEWLYQQMFSN